MLENINKICKSVSDQLEKIIRVEIEPKTLRKVLKFGTAIGAFVAVPTALIVNLGGYEPLVGF